MNTNGNGHGNRDGRGPIARLQQLLIDYVEKAQAIRVALDLLHAEATEQKVERPTTKRSAIVQALALEAARKPRGRPPGKTATTTHATKQSKRQESLRLLAAFGAKPMTPTAAGLTRAEISRLRPLIRWGYLKTQAGGFVRTAKAFTV